MFGLFAWFRRRAAAREPLPEAWRELLRAEVPFYPAFDEAARARFEEKLAVFVRTKAFVPAAGMAIDDRVKLLIGAAAARLIMNMPREHYARLTEIIVYPEHYRHPDRGDRGDGSGVGGGPGGGGAVIFGEAHRHGTVVLSFSAVVHGLRNQEDGHDTALHEFAHVLDAADGNFDGTPLLEVAAYSPWARVMSEAFLGLRGRKRKRKRHVLREYGATNEAEFFAVATEAFFEKPRQLLARHPELYRLLADYYGCDPAHGHT